LIAFGFGVVEPGSSVYIRGPLPRPSACSVGTGSYPTLSGRQEKPGCGDRQIRAAMEGTGKRPAKSSGLTFHPMKQATSSSSSDRSTASKSKAKSLKPSAGTLGAIVGAVVGGVVGLALVKKSNAIRKPLATALPKAGKAAMEVVTAVAKDAVEVTKASALKAGDEALTQIKTDAAKLVTNAVSNSSTISDGAPSSRSTSQSGSSQRQTSDAPQPRGQSAKPAARKTTPAKRIQRSGTRTSRPRRKAQNSARRSATKKSARAVRK
jgi:hypothetical protein